MTGVMWCLSFRSHCRATTGDQVTYIKSSPALLAEFTAGVAHMSPSTISSEFSIFRAWHPKLARQNAVDGWFPGLWPYSTWKRVKSPHIFPGFVEIEVIIIECENCTWNIQHPLHQPVELKKALGCAFFLKLIVVAPAQTLQQTVITNLDKHGYNDYMCKHA